MELKTYIEYSHYSEFIKTICADIFKTKPVKYFLLFTNIFLIIFVGVSVLFFLEANKFIKYFPSEGLINAFCVSSVSFLFWLIANWLYRVNYLKATVNQNGTILGDMLITLNESGIQEKGENHSFFCTWSSINKVVETENLIILLTDPSKGVIIPNDKNSNLRAEIIEYVNARIKQNL